MKKLLSIIITFLMLLSTIPVAFAEECEHELVLDDDIKTPVTCNTCSETVYESDSRWAVGSFQNGFATGNVATFKGYHEGDTDQIIAYYVAETVDGNPYLLSFDWAINQGYTQYGEFKLHLYHNNTEIITHNFTTTANPYFNIINESYEYTAEGTLQVFRFVFEKTSKGSWRDSGRTAYLDKIINVCKHTGGNATCTQKAVCEHCNEEYGDFVHDWSNCDGICAENCGAVCAHESFTGIVCDNCGYECTHESYTNGICDLCDFACAHESYTDYKCAECGIDCAHESFTDLVCDDCGFICVHDSYTDGICDLCEYRCPHGNYAEYKCAECGMDCAHESFTDYICDACGASCVHESYTDGVCDACGFACSHESYFMGACEECNFECNHPEDKLTWVETLAPTCVPGKKEATCTVCGLSNAPVVMDSNDYPESEHNYAPNTDYTWYYSVVGATKLILHFSKETEVENAFDDIYLYDANGSLISGYTGKDLSGKVIEIDGNAFSIRLDSDNSSERYGFSFDSIEAVVIDSDLVEETPAIDGYLHDWSDENGVCARGCGVICEHLAEKVATKTVEATCIPGLEWYNCSVCGYGKLTTGDKNDYPESSHNYEDNLDYTWNYSVSNAEKLVLHFSEQTKVEKTYDDIYLYDASGSLIGEYTGTELAGAVIEIDGDSFSIRLDADSSSNYYGFSFDLIEAYIDAPDFVVEIPAVEGYPHDWSNKDGVCARGCGTVCGHESYTESICDECGILEALVPNADGYYEIENAANLFWFAETVNSGNKTANAILMADIDLNGAVWTAIAETGLYYSGYGDDCDYGYAGIFDGNGHVISNYHLNSSSTKDASVGLFGTVSGTVKNLGVKSVTFTDNGKDFRAAAIVGQLITANGLIENCYASEVTIAPGEHVTGGIAGCAYEATVRNCYIVNSVVSGTEGRFGYIVGDSRADQSETDRMGTVSNCYTDGTAVNGTRTGTIENCATKTTEQFISGEVTYLLNGATSEGAWYQTLGENEYPVFSGDKVYYGYISCADDAAPEYTNNALASAEKWEHDIITDAYVAPTCTETGLEEGQHCSRCDDATVEQVVIPNLGHDIITDAYVAPTCTETGLEEGQHCSRCDDATVEQAVIPKLGHDIIIDAYVAPTCTETGLKEGSHCSRCDDATVEQAVIPELGHSFTVYEEVTAPGCEEGGLEKAFCDNGCGESDEQEIPALGHSFTDYVYNEDAGCEYDGTKTADCDNGCGAEDTVAAEGTKSGHADEDNDEYCEHCGEKIRCSFCGDIHKNLLEDIICLILEFFHLVAQAFRISI